MKSFIKQLIKHTPFSMVSIGSYIRTLYFKMYLKKIPLREFSKVLDAGCGEGDYVKNLAIKYPHIKFDAYDINKYKTWNTDRKNISFIQRDLRKLHRIEHYDFCYSIDVLEHIPGNSRVILNLFKALKPGGYVFLHVPKKLQNRILPKKYFVEHENWGKLEHIGDMYSLRNLRQLLISTGFKIVISHQTFGLFGKIAWEIDIITHRNLMLKMLLMPILKFLAHLELINLKYKKGNGILILAVKKA